MDRETGYDRYLMYQYSMSCPFMVCLCHAIEAADEDNQDKLALGFPEEVDAYRLWAHEGKKALYAKCNPRLLGALVKRGITL